MRIISDHRDYYDCVQAQGQDLSCVWVRRMEEVKFAGQIHLTRRILWPSAEFGGRWWRRDVRWQEHLIGFCGRLYPVIAARNPDLSRVESWCYSREEVTTYVKSHFKPRDVDREYFQSRNAPRCQDNILIREEEAQEFFGAFAGPVAKSSQLFADYQCPVFIARLGSGMNERTDRSIIFHGRRAKRENEVCQTLQGKEALLLKDMEFFRQVDPFTAYQEIQMYLMGVLGSSNPVIPEISDTDMRDIKGFDEWSFRKEPRKRKKS